MIKEQKGFAPLHLKNTAFRQWIKSKSNTGLIKKLSSKGKDVTGFTLVEMAVALVLSSLILIALMGTFILQGRAYTATRMSTELQDNARTALDTIEMMVSNAGFGVVKSTSHPPNDAATPDSAAFYFPNYSTGSFGYGTGQDNYKNSTMDGTECSVTQGLTQAQNGGPCPPYGTDSLTFAYRDPQYQGTITGISTTPFELIYTDNFPFLALQPGDVTFLIGGNHGLSALATIAPNSAGGGSGGTVTLDLSGVSTGSAGFYNEITLANPNLTNVAAALSNNGFLEKVNVVHVYVDYSDANHPVLMMQINGSNPLPLADNIEDFQVQFIMDDSILATGTNTTNPDNIMGSAAIPKYPSFANNYFPATDTANHPHQNPLNINAIIITLVARSDVPSQSVATASQQLIADHDTTNNATQYPTPLLGQLANYQRQVYQRIIQLPNIRTVSKLFDNSML